MMPAPSADGGAAAPGHDGRIRALARPLLLAILLAAVLTPGMTVSGRLPDVRIEQVLALPALVLLILMERPLPGLRLLGGRGRTAAGGRPDDGEGQDQPRSGLSVTAEHAVDLALLTVALATLFSTIAAPLLLREPFSPRDLYEVVKLALYWTLFRFALTAARDPATRAAALAAFIAAGCGSAVLGLGQYFDPSGFGEGFGSAWAPAHHLRALVRDGRAFGTVGNPNYFGALMAMLALVGLVAGILSRSRSSRRFAVAGLVLGVLGVVLSGSRGALGMLLAGLAVCTLLPLLAGHGSDARAGQPRARRHGPPSREGTAAGPDACHAPCPHLHLPARAAVGAGVTLAALVLSVLTVEAVPRGRQSYIARVAGAFSPGGDSSLALRLERWRAVLGLTGAGGTAGLPGPAVTETGRPSAGPDARARDTRRKADVRALVEAVRRHRAEHGSLPAGLAGLAAPPVSGLSPYQLMPAGAGFVITAPLEDPADPDYPLFAVGDGGNYLLDGDVETDGSFRTLPGTVVQRAREAALYGRSGLVFRGNLHQPQQRAAVYQQRPFNRAGGEQFTASVWVKLPRPVQGELFLYTNVLYTDGTRADPYARVAADSTATGIWQRLSLTITPHPQRRIDFIGVYLLSDRFTGEAWADGFELVDGPVPRVFTGLAEATGPGGGTDAGAQFRRSPLFGVGPGKATESGTLDNEYVLVLGRYGLLGLAAYLALWGTVLWLSVRRVRAGMYEAGAIAATVAGLLLFNLVAGSLYHLQLMGVFWPLAGLLMAAPPAPAPSSRPQTTA